MFVYILLHIVVLVIQNILFIHVLSKKIFNSFRYDVDHTVTDHYQYPGDISSSISYYSEMNTELNFKKSLNNIYTAIILLLNLTFLTKMYFF